MKRRFLASDMFLTKIFGQPATHVSAGVWLTVVAATGASASDIWMSNERLQATFGGKTIVGQYADGRAFREAYAGDGSLDYVEEKPPRRLHGHWSIIKRRFCTIYANSSTGGCYRVRQVSTNCFEFYFEWRTEEQVRQSTPRNPTWTARAWRIDSVSTCEERPMV